MITSRIVGTGSYVPEQIVTNDDLAKIVETNDEWIRTRTGIRQRRIATSEGTSDLAAKAAERAIEQAGIKPEEIDLIILATSSQDYCFPSGACEVQGRVGAVNAVCYDLSAACTGFVFALNTAQAFIQSGVYRTALVVGSEVLSKLIDWKDRSTCVLFGDGAGAVLLRAEEGAPVYMAAHSDGVKGPALTGMSRHRKDWKIENDSESYIHMDGQAVFKFAVRKVPEIIEEVLDRAGIGIDEIDYFVLHQANRRIIEAAAKRLKTDITKFPMNLEEYANTSAATVPILLDEMNREGSLHKGQKIMLAGFGAGLTWAACLFEWK